MTKRKPQVLFTMCMALLVLVTPTSASAATLTSNQGDTAWVLIASALVLLMTPGIAFFYGGLVRNKNVITTMFQVMVVIFVVSIQWVVIGYGLAFGPDFHHFIGHLSWTVFSQAGFHPFTEFSSTIPGLSFSIFQMMFAVITPALIIGGLAERAKFAPFIVFVCLWTTVIYDPLAHWVWGTGGWLHTFGVLDFAGGTVVHISSGVAGLVAAIYLGRRTHHGTHEIRAHNVPFVLLGTALLWFGWFGFNAGSALSANGVAAMSFLTTNIAAAAAALSWMTAQKLRTGHTSLVGACAGAIAGLVAITPACGYVSPLSAIVIGGIGGIVCFASSTFMKSKLGYDDALDAFGGHGIGGTWGALATGLFSSSAINSGGANGLFYGNSHQVLLQLVGIAASWVFSGLGTWFLLWSVDKLMGFRVSEQTEVQGLDSVLHNEAAYPEIVSLDDLRHVFGSGSSKSSSQAD